ncbi:hypothetical protein VNO78_16114 [Psophocarpus tetragonolobus]|uniref:Uncharacterized protein n=1 Tax=Psophocarpus tetragonolobus TaxID=3891 RepID=A0AAN9SLP8_PSOTE
MGLKIKILGLLAMLLFITQDVAAARDIKEGEVVKSTKEEVGDAKSLGNGGLDLGFPAWLCGKPGCCFWTVDRNCYRCCEKR